MLGTLKAKKQVSVLVSYMLISSPRKKALECFFGIYYPVQFKKNTVKVQALINLQSEINVIASTYAKKLDLWMQKTNFRAQKIDGSTLETYDMVIVGFQV